MACEITVPSVLSDRLVLAGAQPGVQARLAQRHLLVRELDLGAHVREPGREHRAEQREGGPRVAGPREARSSLYVRAVYIEALYVSAFYTGVLYNGTPQ